MDEQGGKYCEHGERIVRLEANFERIMYVLGEQSKLQAETRDELRQFRTGLFSIVNPLLTKVSELETDVAWVKRTRPWAMPLGIGGAGGVLAMIWDWIQEHWPWGAG